jgi:hypothetical protein
VQPKRMSNITHYHHDQALTGFGMFFKSDVNREWSRVSSALSSRYASTVAAAVGTKCPCGSGMVNVARMKKVGDPEAIDFLKGGLELIKLGAERPFCQKWVFRSSTL